jgi:hypothetical protein
MKAKIKREAKEKRKEKRAGEDGKHGRRALTIQREAVQVRWEGEGVGGGLDRAWLEGERFTCFYEFICE